MGLGKPLTKNYKGTCMSDITIYYDGDCPFCKSYITIVNIKKKYTVELKNARSYMDEINELEANGFFIEDGILMKFKEEIFQGADALRKIDTINKNSSLKAALYGLIINLPMFKKIIYPIVKLLRILTLKLLGVKRIK